MAVTINGNGSVTGLSNEITNEVLEQFFYPCNGETVTTSAGDITLPDVDAVQNGTTTYVDLTGSSIAYTPPSGTKTVVYKFQFWHGRGGDSEQIGHFKFFIDSDEVTDAYLTHGGEDKQDLLTYEWPVRIGGNADTATGRVASWSSAKTLKLQYRDYGNSNDTRAHECEHSDGGGTNRFVRPRIGITALSI